MTEPTCEQVRSLTAEIALGIASGDDRAELLRHISGCPGCRDSVAEMTLLADQLLLAAPVHEPPVGFESRVIQAIGQHSDSSDRPTRLLRTAAIGLVAAVLAATAMWFATASDRRLGSSYRETLAVANGRYFSAVPLVASDDAKAAVAFAYEGDPSWIFLTIEDDRYAGHYDLSVYTTEGQEVEVGRALFGADDEGWGSAIGVDVHDIAVIRLERDDGLELTGAFDRSD